MPTGDPEPVRLSSSEVVSPGATGEPAIVVVGPARAWVLTLVAGLVAGLAAWLGGEACLDLIKPPRHAANSKGLVLRITDRREIARADARNAGLAFAILGGSLGMGLGVAGGLIRRSGRAAGWAALLGLVVGAAGAAGISLAVLPAYNSYKARYPDEAARDLVVPLLVHTVIWSAVGAVAGLAFGFGLGDRRLLPRTCLGGLAGAALGSVAYEVIGAAAFPAAQTTQFIASTWSMRLFARLAVTTLAGAGVALAIVEPRQPAPRSPK